MKRSILAASSVLAVFLGCAHSPSSPAPPAVSDTPGRSASRMASCPMAVPGTQVSVADAVNGETITFTTKEQVAELRTRVRNMAAMHNQHHGAGRSHPGMHGAETLSPSFATVIDIENGSSILLTPNDPGDLQKLQAEVRTRAQRMRQDGCGMVEHTRGS